MKKIIEFSKRFFKIIVHPFNLLYWIISFPFIIIKLIHEDRKEKSIKHSSLNQIDFLEIGKLIFIDNKNEFQSFFNLFISDRETFLQTYNDALEDYSNFELNKINSLEALYIFGDIREQLIITDWKGEENEKEIESFFETNLKIESDWSNSNKLRSIIDERNRIEGKFIVELLKAIDSDLRLINKKILFLNLEWDAYVYTVVDKNSYNKITEKDNSSFYGTEKM